MKHTGGRRCSAVRRTRRRSASEGQLLRRCARRGRSASERHLLRRCARCGRSASEGYSLLLRRACHGCRRGEARALVLEGERGRDDHAARLASAYDGHECVDICPLLLKEPLDDDASIMLGWNAHIVNALEREVHRRGRRQALEVSYPAPLDI